MSLLLMSLHNIAYAQTATFYFHIQYIGLEFNAKSDVTNTATGYSVIDRGHLLPFVHDTRSFSWTTGFPEGSSVRGSMTNFSTGFMSCDTSTIRAGAADFYVSAR